MENGSRVRDLWEMVLPLFFIYYFLLLSESAESMETNEKPNQKYQEAGIRFHLSA